MSTGWIIFLVCIAFVLGAALPLISNRDARSVSLRAGGACSRSGGATHPAG